MEDKILVIGNGFDLAHGLKTRYKDFIEFIKLEEFDMISRYKEDNKLSEEKIKENIDYLKIEAACERTFKYRNTIFDKNKIHEVVNSIEGNSGMKARWNSFAKKNTFAKNIKFEDVIDSCRDLLNKIK